MVSCLVSTNQCPEDLVKRDIEVLQQLRAAATSVNEPSDLNTQHLIRYCQQLRYFAPRFVGLEPQLKVTFSWNDAYGINFKASSSSFYFDLACCLWNLAALESFSGARLDRTNEDKLRAANKHFQQAAGYIEFIRLNVLSFLPNLGNFPCLSEDSLNMAQNLLLAQAQLCFYEKAVQDKKKDSMKSNIIAKLAKQTSLYYHSTSVCCKVGVLGSMLDISWFAVTDFQSKVLGAAAEYWQAQASKEAAVAAATGYGEEVARYCRADTQIGLAMAVTAKHNVVAESLIYGATGLRDAIQQRKAAAENDLRVVYMEAVPSDYSLADVQPVAMVRPAPLAEFAEGASSPSASLFKYVLPQHIRAANQKYTEEINALFYQVSSAAEGATNQARSTLSARGLPGSLEAAKTEDPLPPSLWAKVQ
jgi:programmed cell death 6-interacting protein